MNSKQNSVRLAKMAMLVLTQIKLLKEKRNML